eukprot:g6770.t1
MNIARVVLANSMRAAPLLANSMRAAPRACRCARFSAQAASESAPSSSGRKFAIQYVVVSSVVWGLGVKMDLLLGPVQLFEQFIVLPFEVYRGGFKRKSMGTAPVEPAPGRAPDGAAPPAAVAGTADGDAAAAPSLKSQLDLLRALEADVIAHPVNHGSRLECLTKLDDIRLQKKQLKVEIKAARKQR